MKRGVLIPVYNHGEAARGETVEILKLGYPVILVDDGSCQKTKESLKKAQGLGAAVTIITNERNMGKGGAVIRGMGILANFLVRVGEKGRKEA